MMINEQELITYKALLQEAFRLAKSPIIIALFLTPIRFTLEFIGISENYIFLVGLLWLTIGISIFWSIRYHDKKRFLIMLILSLIIYSPISRFPVAIAWLIDTHWELGTHFGLYFDNFGQAVFNQVIYGSLIQIIPGFLLGSITFMIMNQKQALKLKNNTLKNG